MAKVNQEKTDRAALIAKAWQALHYQTGPVNCGNCSNASSNWEKTRGECNLIELLHFPVSALGVCRMHSNFKK